ISQPVARGVGSSRSRPHPAARRESQQQWRHARERGCAHRGQPVGGPLDGLARRRASDVRGPHMIQTSLHTLDIVIIVAYLTMLGGIGLYFSRRQKSLDEYFLAKQSMAWLPVGLSLMAARDRAIDYLTHLSATIRYRLSLPV